MKPKHPWNVIDFFFNNSSFIRILHGHLREMAEASNQVPKSRDEPGIMLLYLQGKGRQRSWNNSTSSQIKWLVNQHSTACSLITLKNACLLLACASQSSGSLSLLHPAPKISPELGDTAGSLAAQPGLPKRHWAKAAMYSTTDSVNRTMHSVSIKVNKP